MTENLDQVLSDFIDAWNDGRRPRVGEHLQRVDATERDALGKALAAFLEIAPTPQYDEAARAAIRSEPALAGAYAEIGPPVAPEALASLRERAGLALSELAARLGEALGLGGDQRVRTQGYLERLETGDLDPTRVSRRLLDALGTALGVPGAEVSRGMITPRGAGAGSAGALLFRAGPGAGQDRMAAEIDALSRAATTPAPPAMDELDRLFCGGPDA